MLKLFRYVSPMQIYDISFFVCKLLERPGNSGTVWLSAVESCWLLKHSNTQLLYD